MGQGIDAALSSLLIDLGAAVGAIRAALPQEAPTNGGGGSSRDPRTVVEPLTRLKRLLETDDGEAADFMIDARSQLAWVLTTTEITSLEIHLSNYDFERALRTLTIISSRLSLDLT